MKLWDYYKIINFSSKREDNKKERFLYLNNKEVENIKIINYKSHHQIYKMLRAFQTPQYHLGYLMNNKKGFNTLLFRLNYDVVICDKDGLVLDVLIDIKPGFFSQHYPKGWKIYFFAVGYIKTLNIKKNDRLTLEQIFWRKYGFKKD